MKERQTSSSVFLLLVGPGLALVTFAVEMLTAPHGEQPHLLLDAASISAREYAVGLALWVIFGTAGYAAGAPYRKLEILVGSVGLTAAVLSVGFSWRVTGVSVDRVKDVLPLVAASACTLIPGPSLVTRSITLGVMALAGFRWRLFYSYFPFVSLSLVYAVASVWLLARAELRLTPNLRAVGQLVAGTLATAAFGFGLVAEYRLGFIVGVVIAAAGTLFFGLLTILRFVLGDYWWERSGRGRSGT